MSERSDAKPGMIRLSLGYAAVWLTLMLLLGVSLLSAHLRLDGFGAVLQLGIAAVQALLIWLLFMNLRGSSGPVRICAVAGLLWLIFLFTLSFADYATRDWNGALAPFSERAAKVDAK
jgi:cytochrome c oxidase subunit IV